MLFDCAIQQLFSSVRPEPLDGLELAALRLVVRHEKVLDASQQALVQVVRPVDLQRASFYYRHGDQAVVADGLACLGLQPDEGPDKPRDHEASRKQRFLGHQHYIQRVAVLAARTRNRAKVVRKIMAGRKDAPQLQAVQLLVELVLVAAAARRIDDDVDKAGTGARREASERILHVFGGWYWDRTSGPCCVRAVLYR